MCGAQHKGVGNEYMSRNPDMFNEGANDTGKWITRNIGGRDALTPENQARYDKTSYGRQAAAPSLGSGSGAGAASARGQPAATTVSSTILGGQ